MDSSCLQLQIVDDITAETLDLQCPRREPIHQIVGKFESLPVPPKWNFNIGKRIDVHPFSIRLVSLPLEFHKLGVRLSERSDKAPSVR
jgi:hypothetical protein